MNIVQITDLTDPAVAAYARLTEAQLRNRLEPQRGIFIAESLKVIRIALAMGYEPLSFLSEDKHLDSQVAPLVGQYCPQVPVYTAGRAVLAALTGYELSRGILCAMRRPTLPPAAEVCHGCRRVAVIDNVVNSTNTGAIFRAAAALGIEAVLLTPTSCDPLNRRSLRVSMGTVLQLPWTYVESIGQLRALGFTTVALALTADALPIDSAALRDVERMAIVMGTEGDGLSRGALAQCDHVAMITMQRGVDSLNVAAAAAVAFYQFCR